MHLLIIIILFLLKTYEWKDAFQLKLMHLPMIFLCLSMVSRKGSELEYTPVNCLAQRQLDK